MTRDDVMRAVAEAKKLGPRPPELVIVTPSIDALCDGLGVSKDVVADPATATCGGLRVIVSGFVDRPRVVPAECFAPPRYDVPMTTRWGG
jgi:hypothetical protein